MINFILMIFVSFVVTSIMIIIFLFLNYFTKKVFSANWHFNTQKLIFIFGLIPFYLLLLFIDIPKNIIINPIQNVSYSYYEDNLSETDIDLILTNKKDINHQKSYINKPKINVYKLLFYIWSIGFIIYITWYIYCFIKFHKKIRAGNIDSFNSNAYEVLKDVQKDMNILKKIKIKTNSNIQSPMNISLFSPSILLPIREFDNMELYFILYHESIHIKRKDLLFKMLVLFVNAIYWFNPLMYIFRKSFLFWCELSCDESLVISMDITERKQYGFVILNSAQTFQTNLNFCSSFSSTQNLLKRRLIMLLNKKQAKKSVIALSVGCSILLGSLGVSTGMVLANTLEINNISTIENKNSLPDNIDLKLTSTGSSGIAISYDYGEMWEELIIEDIDCETLSNYYDYLGIRTYTVEEKMASLEYFEKFYESIDFSTDQHLTNLTEEDAERSLNDKRKEIERMQNGEILVIKHYEYTLPNKFNYTLEDDMPEIILNEDLWNEIEGMDVESVTTIFMARTIDELKDMVKRITDDLVKKNKMSLELQEFCFNEIDELYLQ